MQWNIADLYDIAEKIVPADKAAIIEAQTGRETSWGELSRRTNNLAADFRARCPEPGEKVAVYMRNCAEYIETVIACEKARLVPVNVNFRYVEDELAYVLNNSDARIVVYEAEYADTLAPLLNTLNSAKHFLEVNLSGTTKLGSAELYEPLCTEGSGHALDIQRSGDDLVFVYTGGTTGLPKAVMWPQSTLFQMIGTNAFDPAAVFPTNYEDYAKQLRKTAGARTLIPVPLMHGAGIHVSQTTLLYGGTVILTSSTGFDAEQLLNAIETTRGEYMVIVGDAFGKPLLDALNKEPQRWDLSSMRSILSSAMTFSIKTKKGLLEHLPNIVVVDTLGASETPSIAMSVSMKGAVSDKELELPVNAETKVFNEDYREIEPGSNEVGMLARAGHIPLGYYKDPEKTAKAFRTINGVRYAIPGDYAKVLDNGLIQLLGRGNVSINSGGEKIYPDEVETHVKHHPAVADAIVVGVPDDRFGQAVAAVIQFKPNEKASIDDIRGFARGKLAAYKIPKHIVPVDSINRGANGKADYPGLKARATTELGL